MERDELQLEGWDYEPMFDFYGNTIEEEVETCEHDSYCYCSPWYCGCSALPGGRHDPVEEDE